MLHERVDGAVPRWIDRALLVAASVSLGFGLTVMLAGLLR